LSHLSRTSAALVATSLATLLTASLAATPAVSGVARSSATTSHRHLRPAHFTVSSFNVLGSSHTPRGGRRAAGTTRILWVDRLLNRHHVDVAGFQELQSPQVRRFLAITRGRWAVYPGLRLDRLDSDNSIGWRTAKFTLLQATTIRVPYFEGHTRRMPLVLLRERSSGMMVYVANFHNPASAGGHHNQGRWRLAASRVEIRLQNRIVHRGIPRVMTGDMNERAPYFCRVTAHAPLQAARPSSYRSGGACHANRPRAVDWILGSLRLRFSHYVEDRSPLVDRTTDHPVIVTDVTVDPQQLPRGWRTRPPRPVVFPGP
jgi:hypothetical protein